MEIVYKAVDGAMFASKDDCEIYEVALEERKREYKLVELYNNSFYVNVVDFIINEYDKIKEIMDVDFVVKTDWTKVPPGTMIMVRDCDVDFWEIQEFHCYAPHMHSPFYCRTDDSFPLTIWKHAKLATVKK